MSGSISIVMLTYNNFEKFMRCMSSMFLLITDDRIKEFIILDNGSYQVELKQFLASLDNQIKKFRVVYSDVNHGIATGRRLLYDMAEGDYIASFDSDVIIINPAGFLEVFYKALDIEGMMLVGGGGGDHPYFPSMERENIINHDSPEKPDQLRFVHEVAGWFHGFKTSILKKHGGFLEMDDQFTPFWGEDSDLCVQIRLNGGKCCIMGKGLLAHQWSSCDKKETQLTLEEQWIKFQNKWYSKFGEAFVFKMDEKFYEENYPESKAMISRKEYYLKVGTIKGHIHSKSVIQYYFPDVDFSDNTKLDYLGNSYSVEEFDKKFMTQEAISDSCLVFRENKLRGNFDDLIIFVMKDRFKGVEILKALISYQKINVIVVVPERDGYTDLLQFFDRFKVNFAIATFPMWDLDLLPYVLSVKRINLLGIEPKRIVNLSTDRNISHLLHKPLSEFSSGVHFEENLVGIDRMNLSILNQFMSMNSSMKWDKECCFVENYGYLLKLFNSYPFQQLLIRALKVPNKYHNLVTPRCSPKDALERAFVYLKPKINNKPILYLLIFSIEFEEDIERLKKNVKYYKGGEVMLFNKGSLRNINLRDIGCSYYYLVPPEAQDSQIWTSAFSQENGVKLENYSNVVFSDDSFELETEITQYLERSKYKDISFMRNKDGHSEYLFSLVSEDIPNFLQDINKENAKIQEVFNKMNFVSLWEEKSTEDEDEIVIEYNMTDYDDGSDFPMIRED